METYDYIEPIDHEMIPAGVDVSGAVREGTALLMIGAMDSSAVTHRQKTSSNP